MEGDAETRFARTLQTDAITTCVRVCVCVAWRLVAYCLHH